MSHWIARGAAYGAAWGKNNGREDLVAFPTLRAIDQIDPFECRGSTARTLSLGGQPLQPGGRDNLELPRAVLLAHR